MLSLKIHKEKHQTQPRSSRSWRRQPQKNFFENNQIQMSSQPGR